MVSAGVFYFQNQTKKHWPPVSAIRKLGTIAMKEVKPPKKSMFSYYCIALLIIILFNSFVYPRLVKTQIKSVDYGTFLDLSLIHI